MSEKKVKPKLYKPKIKPKILSNSESMFPDLYKKKNFVSDDFSKIYITNEKVIKEVDPIEELKILHSKEKMRIRNLSQLNNLNNYNDQLENNTITSPNVFTRDTINNRFMYSLKTNQTKRQTSYAKNTKYGGTYSPNKFGTFNFNDLSGTNDNIEKILIRDNYDPMG